VVAANPSSQDEWTIHALNIHGAFFERRCAAAVSDTSSWKVLSTNYPVEFPPPNGPWRGKESSLDIWARRDHDSALVVDVLIECKKANPDLVNWVFFPKTNSPSQPGFRFCQTINRTDEGGSGSWLTETRLQVASAGMFMADEAREVRGDYAEPHGNNNKKTKTSNAAIQDAAHQIALAARAIMHEEAVLLGKARASAQHPAPPWVSKAYIPVIATTANLFRVDFQPRAISIESGEIGLHDALLTPVQAMLYEYALPKPLQDSPSDPLLLLKSEHSDAFSRMHIFVVRAPALAQFLETLFVPRT
jgi:hypothetical protein